MKQIALWSVALGLLLGPNLHAAEVIPPRPDRYFNDYAGVVSTEAARRLNEQLAQFERDTSSQVVVAVWQTMPSASSIEDFAQRTFQAWEIGQKGRNNGALFLVFIKDRKMRIHSGYGLEGALPDATCDQIIRNGVAPHFRNSDYEKGLATGIDLIFKAIRGEYAGTGLTAGDRRQTTPPPGFWLFLILVVAFYIFVTIKIARARPRRGYRYSHHGGPFVGGWSGGSSGGWSSGGGGGGGFSGGGGSSGGGGASGGW